ncbi:MAG: DUF992 domain-containing protein [Proteobacteria bacterium]|nr:DUF992 domain-containing protein [Pseudomonadota bacterium]
MLRRFSLFLIAAALLALAQPDAHAQSRLRVGVLECAGAGGANFIIAGVHEFNCTFRPDTGPAPEFYRGIIRNIGVDIGFTNRSTLTWAVFAPTQRIGRGALSGTYGGVTASATVGVGLGANALVGGSNNTFALQPLSVGGQTGLQVAGGVATFELQAR